MAIRGVSVVTLLPPVATFCLKPAKYRCFRWILGWKLRWYWAKTLISRFNIRLFQSFFAILLGNKGRKIRSDAVKNASRCSICYVPTQQKLRPDVVKDTSWRNFRSVRVAIKERLFRICERLIHLWLLDNPMQIVEIYKSCASSHWANLRSRAIKKERTYKKA